MDHNHKKRKKLSSTESFGFSFLLFDFFFLPGLNKRPETQHKFPINQEVVGCAGAGEVRLGARLVQMLLSELFPEGSFRARPTENPPRTDRES